jgi:hypothetical protein
MMNEHQDRHKDARPRPKVKGSMDAFAKPMSEAELAAQAAASSARAAAKAAARPAKEHGDVSVQLLDSFPRKSFDDYVALGVGKIYKLAAGDVENLTREHIKLLKKHGMKSQSPAAYKARFNTWKGKAAAWMKKHPPRRPVAAAAAAAAAPPPAAAAAAAAPAAAPAAAGEGAALAAAATKPFGKFTDREGYDGRTIGVKFIKYVALLLLLLRTAAHC